MSTEEQIEKLCRENLDAAYQKYPMGCDEDQMREFLATRPYPELTYAFAMGWEDKQQELITKALQDGK